MPVYTYKALKGDGAAEAGVIDADSPKDARLKLKSRNLHVTDLQSSGAEPASGASASRLSAKISCGFFMLCPAI